MRRCVDCGHWTDHPRRLRLGHGQKSKPVCPACAHRYEERSRPLRYVGRVTGFAVGFAALGLILVRLTLGPLTPEATFLVGAAAFFGWAWALDRRFYLWRLS